MEDCYFFIDYKVPYEKRKISVCCVECKEKYFPDTPMFFHPGSSMGYGPYDYKCCKCNKYVHKKEEFYLDEEQESDDNQRQKTDNQTA